MTENELPVEFAFEGGIVLKAVLERIKGPLIVEDIKSKLPVMGRVAVIRGEMKITIDIGRGNLKPTRDVKRGEIAYQPLGDTLDIYLKDMRAFSPVNVIGMIKLDNEILDSLCNVRRGSRAEIRLVQNKC